MADNYQISVGVKADFSELKAAQADANESLKSAQALWEAAFAVLGKSAEQGSQQAISALAEYSSALEKAKARVAELTAQQLSSTVAAMAAADAQRTLANQTRIATEEARAMSGSMLGLARVTWREYNCERRHSSLEYRTPEQFRRSIGYANVESKVPFPHSHSRDDDRDENKISKQNRETPVMNG